MLDLAEPSAPDRPEFQPSTRMVDVRQRHVAAADALLDALETERDEEDDVAVKDEGG